MDIQLRVGKLDALLVEGIEDRGIELVSGWNAVVRRADKNPDGKIQGTVPVGIKKNLGRRFQQHPIVLTADLVDSSGNFMHIGIVGYSYFQG